MEEEVEDNMEVEEVTHLPLAALLILRVVGLLPFLEDKLPKIPIIPSYLLVELT